MATKKKEGMLGKAVRGLGKTGRATGVTPIRARPKASTPKPAQRPNTNKPGPKITTSAAKAAAQKAAIRKKIDDRVKKNKR